MKRTAFLIGLFIVSVFLSLTAWAGDTQWLSTNEKSIDRINMAAWHRDTITASPDAKHIAYVADTGVDQYIVADGREGIKYGQVISPIYSPDSKHLAYRAKHGRDAFAVLDGLEQARFHSVARLLFSVDGNHLAYWRPRIS